MQVHKALQAAPVLVRGGGGGGEFRILHAKPCSVSMHGYFS